MEITKAEPVLFDAGLNRVWCFVRVETDGGIDGWGEATTTEPYMVAGVVRRLADWLVGQDARRIQDLWQRMYALHHNVRGGNLLLAAISGVEHALWDIKGKAAGLPVYELLGGAMREQVPVYANHMFFPSGADPDAPARYRERAAEAVQRGYRAVKIAPFGSFRNTISPAELRHVCAIVGAVRDAVGPDVEIGIDTHGRFGMAAALRVAHALEQFDPYFLEELAPPENVAALRKLREATRVPLATGERVYTKWGFRELLEAQAVEIVQVDVAHCGGILEARLIAALAECHYVQVAPHSWYGPVSLAASLHLDACIPNFLIQETPVPHVEPAQQRDLLVAPLVMQGGCMAIPSGPGLGVTLNEDVLARHRVEG
jgi:galactonate dehydratase